MDKLTIIRRAAIATGNRVIDSLADGSEEWQTADIAWDRCVEDLLSRHDWPFARTTAVLIKGDDDENLSQVYDYWYPLPSTCLQVKTVYVDGAICDQYEVIGPQLCLDYGTGVVSITFFTEPSDAYWHKQTAEVLTLALEVAYLQGHNEDFDEAARRTQVMEYRLAEARARTAQENPARNLVYSTISAARRTRRG